MGVRILLGVPPRRTKGGRQRPPFARSGAVDEDATASGIRVTGVAYPYNADLIVLGTWNVMPQAQWSLEFYIRPHPDPSLPRGLPAIRRDGQWLRCGVSSGLVDLPVANLNGPCPVALDLSSFGAVKSLYR